MKRLGALKPIKLFSRTFPSKVDPAATQHMVILHGLFGSGNNWRSLAGQLAERLPLHIHTLDLRAHGQSPAYAEGEGGAGQPLDLATLASDVEAWLEQHTAGGQVTLMGHSLGGKVAMQTALLGRRSAPLHRLIAVDIAPRAMQGVFDPSRSTFWRYMDAMKHIEQLKLTHRKDVDAHLTPAVPVIRIKDM